MDKEDDRLEARLNEMERGNGLPDAGLDSDQDTSKSWQHRSGACRILNSEKRPPGLRKGCW